jgi:23S rRNA pseudouridine2605 synthase
MVLCMLMEQRLQKILASQGVASRRKAEEIIIEGRVTVNGEVATIGMKADPETDYIKLDGKLIVRPMQKVLHKVYLMFYKPPGVVTTMLDPEGRPAVKDYLKAVKHRLFPVGRLDYDSEGLLLLTNDGEFANAILHPSHEIPKTYLVKVKGLIDEDILGRLRRGIRLEDGVTLPAKVKKIRHSENNSWIEIAIYEGKKREVRRMLEKVGHPVMRLKRIGIGGLKLQGLKPGEMRHLTPDELRIMKRQIGIGERAGERRSYGS